jgi:hypothetical protein
LAATEGSGLNTWRVANMMKGMFQLRSFLLAIPLALGLARVGAADNHSCREEEKDGRGDCPAPKPSRPAPRPTRPPQALPTKLELRAGDKASAGAEVFVDDVSQGYLQPAPRSLVIELPPGRHTIAVRKSGYQELTRSVDLKRGATDLESFGLTAIPPPVVASPPPPPPVVQKPVEPPSAPSRAGPPSPTLTRALKLYDAQDFLNAEVEFTKVLAGESGDDTVNKQRAEFFDGKALFNLRYYVPALARFNAIAQAGPTHVYYDKALQWLAALVDKVPLDSLGSLTGYPLAEFAQPALEPDFTKLIYTRGRLTMRPSSYAAAVELFERIPAKSADYPRARLAIGIAWLLLHDDAKAHAALASVPAGDFGDLASLANGQAYVREQAWDQALAAYGKVRTTGPYVARGAWEASLARLGKQNRLTAPLAALATSPILDPATLEPAFLPLALGFDFCAGKRDGFAGLDAEAMAKELDALLAKYDDNNDLAAVVVKLRAGSLNELTPRVRVLAQAMLAGPAMTEQLAALDELQRELDAVQKADKQWQTTRGAAEILQDLIVHQSVSETNLGHLARTRLQPLDASLHALAKEPKPALAIVAPGGDGLAIACPKR